LCSYTVTFPAGCEPKQAYGGVAARAAHVDGRTIVRKSLARSLERMYAHGIRK
jgi:hypothetical protein